MPTGLADTRAVVARDESGPRYVTKGPETRAFRLPNPGPSRASTRAFGSTDLLDGNGGLDEVSGGEGGIDLDVIFYLSPHQGPSL